MKGRKRLVSLLLLALVVGVVTGGKVLAESEKIVLHKDFRLREGVAGEEVRELRSFFRSLGYEGVEDSYLYDKKLMEVVKKYQRSKGLAVDGLAGKNTLKKVNKDLAKGKGTKGSVKVGLEEEKTYPEGKWVVINKTNNTLYYLKGRELVGKYHVATGKSPELTPDGKHTFVVKAKNPAWGGAGVSKPIKGGAKNNPLGSRWLGLSYKGGGRYGVHGNSNVRSIGRFASLGCVRMYKEDVEFLYEEVGKGTPVWIGSEKVLGEYGVHFVFP